jgi:hypothetical protein
MAWIVTYGADAGLRRFTLQPGVFRHFAGLYLVAKDLQDRRRRERRILCNASRNKHHEKRKESNNQPGTHSLHI